MGSQSGAAIELGAVVFEPVSREVRRDGETARLSPKAAAVLGMLAEARGRVCSREELLDRLWPSVSVGEEVLTHAIAEIRRALGDNPRHPQFVETVHKAGYRLKVSGRSSLAREASAHRDYSFDLAAYGDCIEAEEAAEQGRRRGNERAIAIYTAVLERNPDFVRARAGLARALLVSAAFHEGGEARLRLAEAHCMRALALDSECADAIAVLGVLPLFHGDFESGERHFARALSLAPHSFEIHELIGRACYAAGRYALAASLLGRAAALRPLDCHPPLLVGKAKLRLGDRVGADQSFALALTLAERRLKERPDDVLALQTRADALWRLGKIAEAMALARSIVELTADLGSDRTKGSKPLALVRQGKRLAETVGAIAR